MALTCFTCRAKPAGTKAQPYSAYCADHQPAPGRRLTGNQSQCARCRIVFGGLADFDRHNPGRCIHPADLGLIEDNGVWLSAASSERRRQASARMTDLRRSQLAQTALEASPG